MFLFCITTEPVYANLREVVGEEGVLYTYCDDSYLLAPMEQMATVIHQAPCIFSKVELRIGYEPGKTELIQLQGCSRQDFPFPLDDPHAAAPQVVACFKSCLGVPIRFDNDPEFLNDALQAMGTTLDMLMGMAEEVADEQDPFATLRRLQTCGISRFGQVLSAVPPPLAQAFAIDRDEAIAATIATI
jgi:hypothetical protein